MLQLRCTKKVLDTFGYKSANISEIVRPDSVLGNWYVTQTQIDRRKTLVFMNERTLLSFVRFGLRKDNAKDLELVAIKSIAQLLEHEGFTDSEIEFVLSDYMRIEVTKTDNRKALGSLNDLVRLYDVHIYSDGGFASCDLTAIMANVNRTPQRNIGWRYSIDVVKELIRGDKMS